MTFEKLFKILSYAAVFCGFFSLWVSGTFGVIGTAIFIAVMIGGVVFGRLAVADFGTPGNGFDRIGIAGLLRRMAIRGFGEFGHRSDARRDTRAADTFTDGDKTFAKKIRSRLDISLPDGVFRGAACGRTKHQCIVPAFVCYLRLYHGLHDHFVRDKKDRAGD